MSRRILFFLPLLVSLVLSALVTFPVLPADWQVVGAGVEYREYQLTAPVPVNLFVARMDRANPNVTIESSIAQGRLSGGLEPVSEMAERYDQALNYWGLPTIPVTPTWGSRNDVTVAINGFYYGSPVEPPGVPWSGQIHSGWYAKRFSDFESTSGFIWKMDRSAFIGECIYHPEDKQYLDFATGEIQYIDGINRARGADELILFTPQYDSDTNTDNSGVEVLVEMQAPTFIALARGVPFGVVREIRQNKGSTPIPFDHIVLSASGTATVKLLANVAVGDQIGVAQKVKECVDSTAQDWERAYAGVGGAFYFLRGGVIFPYSDNGQATARDPRTAIAYNEQYVFFVVADGRNPGVSEGMTIAELAAFAKDTLGATYGIAQDGGGSSTMIVNDRLMNLPPNPEMCEYIYMPLVMADGNFQASAGVASPAIVVGCERWVANGMMMVAVEPPEYSQTFGAGNLVATTAETALRLGPGSNYAALLTLPVDSVGEVVAHTNGLDGVLAKGSYWWKVDFNEGSGWVAEEFLAPQLKTLREDGR
jgi:hypothetical protein